MSAPVLIVGSFGLDTQSTPFGKVKDVIGGSGPYAALGARFFAKTAVVGSVGNDYPKEFLQQMQSIGIDTSGLQYSKQKSFRWFAEYGFDVNARTERVELNALLDLKPELSESFKKLEYLFLATENPSKQKQFLDLFEKRPKLVLADTIKLWIEEQRNEVLEMVTQSDFMMMNDGEARELFKTPQLSKAAQEILNRNSEFALIKKGENGAVLFSNSLFRKKAGEKPVQKGSKSQIGFFAVPGYPLESVKDPTGCGDSFAGALLGFLANKEEVSEKVVRKGMVFASAVASFNAESFSCDRLLEITKKDIENRVQEFKEIVRF
ncbi:sugar kinase [Candidatus Micrarchaeota archaeon]|nr:sugar kinase [Candidatus Micrarchaeota archaeon]MBU1930587.1 sugar kinase [Candidatus Micrarchaeota archaeon]